MQALSMHGFLLPVFGISCGSKLQFHSYNNYRISEYTILFYVVMPHVHKQLIYNVQLQNAHKLLISVMDMLPPLATWRVTLPTTHVVMGTHWRGAVLGHVNRMEVGLELNQLAENVNVIWNV